jgi:hypothetical protein
MPRRAGPRSWLAVLAAVALVLQGLIPAAAMAHDHAGLIQLCTSQGVTLVGAPGGHGQRQGHFGGLACEQCVMASFAAVGAEPPAPPPPAAPAAAPPPARAPPRPPSQGPPTFA